MSFVTLRDINYQIKDNRILKNINLQLQQNDITALVGHNGSGKTTLGKVIMGMIRPKGKVLINSKDISNLHLAEIGKEIGYLFQNPSNQIFTTTVVEELNFVSKFSGAFIEKSELNHVIEVFDLKDKLNSKTFFLSQGEKQRLALACLMINKPNYLILDEPTTGLDSLRKDKLSLLLHSLFKSGVGALIISHDNNFINKHANRVIELKKGEIIRDEVRPTN